MRSSCTWVCVALVVCWCFCFMEASHVVYEDLQSISPSLVNDELKPVYHFRPPRHWINGSFYASFPPYFSIIVLHHQPLSTTRTNERIVSGPLYYKGIYHLFYQYNPYGSVWGNIVWAHSVSADMINWKALDPAIYPSQPFDIYGCWSGSATILPGDKPVIMYTGIDPQKRQIQNIAFPSNLSDPFLREWTKPDDNPVIDPDSGVNASAFRDPTTAWYTPHNEHWSLVVGSRRGSRGVAVLYKSKDFVKWTKAKHPLHSGKGTGMWECPDLYPVALEGNQGLDTGVSKGAGVKHVFKVSLDETRFDYYTVGKYYPKADKYIPDANSRDDRNGLRYDYGNFYASKSFYDPGKKRRILWGWANESDSAHADKEKGWAGVQVSVLVVAFEFRWWVAYDNNMTTAFVWSFQSHFGLQIDHSVVESFGAGGKTCITSRVYPTIAIGQKAHMFVFNNGAEDVKVSELNAWEMKAPEMNDDIIF
ncbi:hypothetical protein GW17_00020879 [Ensete ventricosum]|nr:hypothetical protein GW17_00020879 [Ensete ventricosum]